VGLSDQTFESQIHPVNSPNAAVQPTSTGPTSKFVRTRSATAVPQQSASAVQPHDGA
jgi:hypothetical protein